MPSAGIPMFVDNQTRPFQSVPFSTDRVKRESINLTRTSPTLEPTVAPQPNEEVLVRRESLNIGTKQKPRYSEQHKAAIVQWYENGHDESAIVELFREKFPDGRKLTAAMVVSCLNRWRVKRKAAVDGARKRAKPCLSCKAAIERLENALDKFKKRRDVEITKLRSFRRLAQKKAKAQRMTWRMKYRNQYNANRSEALMLQQRRQELEEQTQSLKKSLRELEEFKADLTRKITENENNINIENGYSRTHDAVRTHQLPTFVGHARSPHQYFVIPSSAIQQIAAQPSLSVHQSLGNEYPATIMPSSARRQPKSQKSRRNSSHLKTERNRVLSVSQVE